MADRIAVMRHGEVLQVGTPQEIYRTPADLFVGEFIGEANLIPGRAVSSASSPPDCDSEQPFIVVDTPLGKMTAFAGSGVAPGQQVRLLIRPESLHVCHDGSAPLAPGWNAVTGLVRRADFAGAHTELTVEVEGIELRAQAHSFDAVSVGSPVTLTVGAQWVVALTEYASASPSVVVEGAQTLAERQN